MRVATAFKRLLRLPRGVGRRRVLRRGGDRGDGRLRRRRRGLRALRPDGSAAGDPRPSAQALAPSRQWPSICDVRDPAARALPRSIGARGSEPPHACVRTRSKLARRRSAASGCSRLALIWHLRSVLRAHADPAAAFFDQAARALRAAARWSSSTTSATATAPIRRSTTSGRVARPEPGLGRRGRGARRRRRAGPGGRARPLHPAAPGAPRDRFIDAVLPRCAACRSRSRWGRSRWSAGTPCSAATAPVCSSTTRGVLVERRQIAAPAQPPSRPPVPLGVSATCNPPRSPCAPPWWRSVSSPAGERAGHARAVHRGARCRREHRRGR